MVRYLRSFVFDIIFYFTSALVMVAFLPTLLMPKTAVFWAGRVWINLIMWLLKSIVGLTYRIEGLENLPERGYIIASKHESAWETLIFHTLIPHPSYALKQELTWIPVMNLYFKHMGTVPLKRGSGASALKSLLQGARQVMAEQRPLVIFPEGTRSMPGKPGTYHTGVAALYRDLNVPVVPVALNSGTFWGRRSFIKYPGQITIQFLPPILPGLSKVEFMEKLVNSIESACYRLKQEAVVHAQKLTWKQRLIKGIFAVALICIGLDYGRHWFLKYTLEKELRRSEQAVSFDSVSIVAWPLLQSHLVIKNFRLQSEKTSLFAQHISLNQDWKNWGLIHIESTQNKASDLISVQKLKGIIDISNLRSQIKAPSLILTGIEMTFPLLSLSSPHASFDFLYEKMSHEIYLKGEAPKIMFPSGAFFGLTGQGNINIHAPRKGEIALKIQNSEQVMRELVDARVIKTSEANLLTMGSNFLGKLRLHDVTLPLNIENDDVFLGPIHLFTLK